jgi:hypothetical protein
MSQNIYLIVFGTFGNPHGFRQSILKRSNESIQLNVKAFDLKTLKSYKWTELFNT